MKHKLNMANRKSYIKSVTLYIEGMTCNHCRQTVESAVKTVRGVNEAIADPGTGIVEIKGNDFDIGEIERNIEKSGYKVVKKL